LRVWNLSGLESDAEYVIRVAAKDEWDNISTLSAPVTLFTGTPMPTGVGETGDAEKLYATPNPLGWGGSTALSFSLDREEPLGVRVFDASGRLVRDLYRGRAPAGKQTLWWNGDDDTGHRVASGVYHVVLVAGQSQQTTKVVIRR